MTFWKLVMSSVIQRTGKMVLVLSCLKHFAQLNGLKILYDCNQWWMLKKEAVHSGGGIMVTFHGIIVITQ